MKKGRAFTLTELLIVAVIVAIVGGAGVSLLYAFLQHEELVKDTTVAHQRGETVMAVLEKPLLHAGLGVPDDKAGFQSAFKIGGYSLYPEVASWDGPVSVKNISSIERLRVVYVVLTYCAAEESCDVTSGDPVEVSFEGELPSGQILAGGGNIRNLKSWVAFPASKLPFFVEGIVVYSNKIRFRASGHVFIAQYDRLCLVRAIEVYAYSGFFYVEDVTTGSGRQPVVEGIASAKFEYDNDKGTLAVTLLCRGAKRYDREVTTENPPLWEGEISDEDRHYRLIAMRKIWRVRN